MSGELCRLYSPKANVLQSKETYHLEKVSTGSTAGVAKGRIPHINCPNRYPSSHVEYSLWIMSNEGEVQFTIIAEGDGIMVHI